tara:strand:+ start:651 stop:1817 length:1167 start_codon:yes stop_codon:yes gene_type:complete
MSNNKKVVLLAYFLIAIFFYLLLICVDIILPRIAKFTAKNSLAISIIEQRKIDEDQAYIDKAIKNGFQAVILPHQYDTYPFNRIIKDTNTLPLGSLIREKTYFCNEGYGLAKYKSDRFGFRNNDDLWNSNIKINTLIVGDSFVHGACVENESTISGNLIKHGIKNINLGMSGNSPIHYAQSIKTFAPIIKPKNIIIVFYANDNNLIDIQTEFYKNFKKNSYSVLYNFDKLNNPQPSPQLINTMKKIDNLVSSKESNEYKVKQMNRFIKLKKYFLLTNTRKLINNISLNKNPEGSTILLIDYVLDLCDQIKCRPNFVIIPPNEFYDPDPSYKFYRNKIHNYLEKKNLNLLDMQDYFVEPSKKFWAIKGPHLSPLGYEIVAKNIIKQFLN